MDTPVAYTFPSAAQRVISSYCRLLSDFHPVFQDGLTAEQQAEAASSQAELHTFFQGLYAALYQAPENFGVGAGEDIYVQTGSKESAKLEDVNKALNKPRKPVVEGINFLYLAGQEGSLQDGELLLEPSSQAGSYAKKKVGKLWLQGLRSAGVMLEDAGSSLRLASPGFSRMMPALQSLALACAQDSDAREARRASVFFARCNLRALAGDFTLDPYDLFRVFSPEDRRIACDMHALLTGRGYHAQAEMGNMHSWVVKYQGKKSIKATPLFQIEFDDRFCPQMRAQIKCASAQRVIPLLATQSKALQDDFAARAITCGSCDWCRNQKTLGPTEYVYNGEQRKVCWWVPGDVKIITPETVGLVREYAELHESLAA